MTKYQLPEPGGYDLESMVTRIKGDWTISSDYHLPFYSKSLVERMMRESDLMETRNLVIAGDLFDFSYLSTFSRYLTMPDADLNSDYKFVRQVLDVLFDHFERVLYLPGNHDRRIQRALQSKINVETLYRLFVPDWAKNRIETSEFPQAILASGDENFRITHPRSFSKQPTKVSSELTLIHRMSVISAHGHHFGLVISPDGQSVAADSGGMFDPRRIDYLHTDGDTTHGRWASGFLIVKEGNVYPYSGRIGD